MFHVDMDAFYASVETRDDPSLKGLPLVVGADPRGGKGRGVVCTASYEARVFGVKSAMPISEAWRRAPHAVYLRPDFARYKQASDAVLHVLEGYADVFEAVGMDEAYLDVTERCTQLARETGGTAWDAALALAHSLQAAVQRETGLSCSVGVAPNKSVAKVASDHRKPHGVTRVPPERVQAFLAPLPVRKLHGCGPKTAAALADEGLRTVAQLAATPVADLERRFGAHGAWLWAVANGRDRRPVEADSGPRKSRGNEMTFLHDVRDPAKVAHAARELLAETFGHHLRHDRRPFATLTVKVRYEGFVTLTRAQTADVPYDAADPTGAARAYAAVQALLRPMLDGRPIRLVGVRLTGFTAPTGQQALARFGLEWAGVAAPAVHAAGLVAKPRGAMDPGGLRWARLPAFA
ncbi:MAG: hypothetical protein QOD77_972 [Thermoplasmata archaeon]|nr:hypothetical protein [Thermoplasmata archaeon]